MIIITEIATKKIYRSCGDVLKDHIGDEWHSAFLTVGEMNNDLSSAWSIRYTPKGRHLQESFKLDPDKFSVSDTDYIAKVDVKSALKSEFDISNNYERIAIARIGDKLGIDFLL